MRKQYLFAGMLAVLCLLSVLLMPVDAQAAEVASGTCGDNATWVLTDDGTLTISGTGKMYDYSSTSAPWYAQRDNISAVVIEGGITSVGARAFSSYSNLSSVTIGSDVTSIGDYAFYGCGLTGIMIRNGVASIGASAFSWCRDLTWAIIGCSSDSVGIGATSIGEKAFYYCDSLTSVSLGSGVGSIGTGAFAECTSLTSIDIPDSVTSIGDSAFNYCLAMTNAIIGDGVTSIGEKAFYYCRKLESVTIGKGVTSIGKEAFLEIYGLDAVYISDIAAWCNIDFAMNSNPLNRTSNFYLNGALVTKLVIPDGVTRIGDWAFRGYAKLTSVTIGKDVTSIGSNAFAGCTGMTSVKLGDGVTSIGPAAFESCSGLTSIAIPNSVTSIGNCAFQYCRGLTSVTIGDGVISIGDSAFKSCSGLAGITIPDSVTSIGNSAFESCSALTNVTIPDSVNSIGYWALAYCESLKKVTFQGDAPTIGVNAFYNVTATAYYPAGNSTWTADVMQDYGGTITWKTNCSHSWIDANCTTPKTCSICGATEGEAKGHSYESVVTAPTCTEQGYTTHTCTACGDSYKDSYVAEKGHAWGEWYTVDEASCTAEGLEQRDCDVCDSFETNILPIQDHSYESVVTAPTCTEQGYTTHTCSACGDSYKDSEVPANGHTEVIDEGVAATCTGSGLTEGSHCAVCQSVLVAQETIPAKGHKDETADYVCDVCGGKLCKDHTQQTIAATAATCEKNGLTEGKVCTTCGEVLKAQEVIPATGHAWQEATCEVARHCTACGKTEGTALGHSYGEWTQVTAPTVEAPGLSERTCATCGGKEQKQLDQLEPPATEPTQPTEPSDQPEATEPTQIAPTVPQGNDDRDGGNGNVILLIVLSALGGAALMLLLVLLVLKKKKDQEDEMQ